MSVDEAIRRVEQELPYWDWSVFSRAEDYQAHLWDLEDRPPEERGPEVFVNAGTPAEALVQALEKALAGTFYPSL